MVNRVDSNQLDLIMKSKSHLKTYVQKLEVETKTSEEQLSLENTKTMTDSINKFLQSTDSHLKFVLHEELSEYYVTIVDTHTDEVIREIPSKKLMDVHAAMKEFVGLLVDQKI